MDLAGRTIDCSHWYDAPAGEQVCVPMLVSSRNYAIVWDNLAWLESVEKLRSIADKTGAEVIFGHDAEQAKTLRYAPNGYYS